MNHDEGFAFPVLSGVDLVNDFMVRREVLEQLPIALAYLESDRLVWYNRWAQEIIQLGEPDLPYRLREMAQELTHHDTYQRRRAYINESLDIEVGSSPIRNLEGDVAGHLVWSGDLLGSVAIRVLETAVLIGFEGRVIWSNPASRRMFGDLELEKSWDEIKGFPKWSDIVQEDLSTILVRRHREFDLRLISIGRVVLGEATLRSSPSSEDHTMPLATVASMVHEIRNALTALSGYVELASMDVVDPEVRGYFDHMTREIERINRLTEDLMAVSRPLSLHVESVSLDALVERAWFSAKRGQLGSRTIRLIRQFPEDQVIPCDPDRFQQILTNVMKNAVEAMEEHGTSITVSCQTDVAGGVLLVVEDDGPGIPPEVLRQLFIKRITTKSQGTGLGLFVIRRMMEAHDGEIHINSGERGTAIQLSLPALAKADLDQFR